MYRGTDIPLGFGQHLALQYLVANRDQWFGRGADVLLQRDNELLRYWCDSNTRGGGHLLVAGYMQSAGEVVQVTIHALFASTAG